MVVFIKVGRIKSWLKKLWTVEKDSSDHWTLNYQVLSRIRSFQYYFRSFTFPNIKFPFSWNWFPIGFRPQFCFGGYQISKGHTLIWGVPIFFHSVSHFHFHCIKSGIFLPCSPFAWFDDQHNKGLSFSS